MKIVYIAEIVGKSGIYAVKNALPELKRLFPYDFAIACADSATGGGGLGRNHAAYLHKLGINVLTTGDYCFYKKDLCENIDKLRYVLRPDNLNPYAPGLGSRVFKIGDKKIAVAVLLGQNSFSRLQSNSPFASLGSLLEKIRLETPNIIIDFHAQASAEKKTMFYSVNGRCSAVIGSHTKVQTADECILSEGTAIISDAGRTGSLESVGGCDINVRIGEYLSGIPDWTKEAWENLSLQGVYLDIGKDGKARSIKRFSIAVDGPGVMLLPQ